MLEKARSVKNGMKSSNLTRRTDREENYQVSILYELQREMGKEERKSEAKKAKKVAKARKLMEVGKEQPGIMDKFSVTEKVNVLEQKREGEFEKVWRKVKRGRV